MTVKQLKNKLKSVPDDYEVTVFNTEMVVSGAYKADSVEVDDDDKQVEIKSNHKYLWNWETKKVGKIE